MGKIRRKYPPSFEAKAALEAIREEKTSAELSSKYGLHPSQIRKWKRIATSEIIKLFTNNRQKRDKEKNLLIERLW